jgi:hypothetical protein
MGYRPERCGAAGGGCGTEPLRCCWSLRRCPPLAIPPVAAQTVAEQPVAPRQPLWPSLQSRLGLPGWINLDLELTADPVIGEAPSLGVAGSWMQQLVLNTT